MAKSQYEYVKAFERPDNLLPHAWIVIRLDGKGFHKFSELHNFEKPNDDRALHLMNNCASIIMQEVPDIVLSYGESDEYSFLFRRDTKLYGRRESKLVTMVTSLFTAYYVYNWNEYFHNTPMKKPPSFDGRAIIYPSMENVRHYFAWRQADCHINNMYNYVFWSLVKKGGKSEKQAELELKGTLSSNKQEILFSQFDINYNNLPEMHRKGTVITREYKEDEFNNKGKKSKFVPIISHIDIIKDKFWKDRPYILE